MEYNLQAEAKTQTAADGSTVTDAMRNERIYQVIAEHDPDVLALLEVNYRWLEQIDGVLTGEGGEYTAYGRAAYGAYHDEKQKAEIWDLTSLILWKTEKYHLIQKGTFWCSKVPDRVASAGWGNGLTGDLPRAINWVILEDRETGAQFLFVAAHLDAKTAEIRALSTELIKNQVAELAQGLPIIVVGDFNCSDNSAAYDGIHGDTLYDARYLIPTYGDMTIFGTYNKFGANTDIPVRLPIDLCFVSPATVWVESATMDCGFVDADKSVYASDHNATIFDLKLTKLHTVEPEPETTVPDSEVPTEPATEPTPEVTDTPTELVTGVMTEPNTESVGEIPTETIPATTPDETDATTDGCGSVLSFLSVAFILPAAFCLLLKKQEE
ncbi:MAG: endonuclease/exonuclease/phosphatase family protein [Clostridia bacterium]|nr:endonuclease/exonuclease/phosphatase family protein [Clostridia bacterium]